MQSNKNKNKSILPFSLPNELDTSRLKNDSDNPQRIVYYKLLNELLAQHALA